MKGIEGLKCFEMVNIIKILVTELNIKWLQSLNSPILIIDAKHEGNGYLPVASYIYGCKDYDTLEHNYMFRFSKWHLYLWRTSCLNMMTIVPNHYDKM